jgi:simple sugar transport system permease protein
LFWRGVLYFLSSGYPLHILTTPYTASVLSYIGGQIAGTVVPVTLLWFVILTIFLAFVLTRTKQGNWTYATGGNLSAAKALGVDTDRIKLITFSLVGALAGLSGVVNMSRYMISDPSLGTGFELQTIAAAVVGGTALTGGYGTIIGTFIGSFLLAQISSGLILIGANPYLYQALTGVIVILAVVFNTYVRKKARL